MNFFKALTWLSCYSEIEERRINSSFGTNNNKFVMSGVTQIQDQPCYMIYCTLNRVEFGHLKSIVAEVLVAQYCIKKGLKKVIAKLR